ncbi:MAG: diadenylate cyclase CdaA [Thermacetogeniaceae bacterium]|jgi:diadenylate cyclase
MRLYGVLAVTGQNYLQVFSGFVTGFTARFLPYLSYIDLRTVIDILAVAFVFYKLLMWIKGTRAIQLLKGLAVLVIASTLSERFQLYTTSWLLEKTWTALFVALPVVFQPELRRALEQLGRGGFFGRSLFNVDEDNRRAVREIVRATEALSRRKVGALIVFMRETGLQEYIDSGIKMDALVTAELIVNVFEPNTPLHDGAAIVYNGRMLAAACFLPLTENTYLSKELGARHRSAIGITEHSDAVSLVVSEETGMISLAEDGRITRGLSIADLEQRLEEYVRPGSKRMGRARDGRG